MVVLQSYPLILLMSFLVILKMESTYVLIVNATNNTEYVCVSVVTNMVERDSEPVYLYVAGMLYHYNKVINYV